MPPHRSNLARYTRDKPFLIKWFFVMIAAFAVSSGFVSYFQQSFASAVTPVIAQVNAIISIIAGAVWFIVLAKICGIKKWRSLTLVIGLAGIVLGWLSAMATGLVFAWQDQVTGMRPNGELFNDLLFWISGVGVREETLKLLFFLPLALAITWRRNLWEMIFAAACVGLGFAIEENIYYYNQGGSLSMVSRFLSANLLHFALTGTVGIALCRTLRNPKRQWDNFLGAFIFVVVLHGVYDFFVAGTLGADAQILGLIILAVITHRFFDQLRNVRNPSHQPISSLSVFIFGTGIIIGLSMNYAALVMPWRQAIADCGTIALASATIGFLYIRELGDD